MINIKTSETKALVAFYNANSGRPVIKKFVDRATAEARCAAIISTMAKVADAKIDAKVDEILGGMLADGAIKKVKKPRTEAPAPKAKLEHAPLVRPGSNRDKVISFLQTANWEVPSSELRQIVYGSDGLSHRGALMMVMKGVAKVADTNGLKLVKTKHDKEVWFALKKA